eukprot:TRINITY_DN8687_c0_g1_i2.p1 TRINITY_DN8687_c0_g1~~TRINITY_DN8687_c0_g1_i2.p1  ORF type:complete len:244 (+),score=23.39 TRINITY_DN8687_c0_g1_i2:56-787(+)
MSQPPGMSESLLRQQTTLQIPRHFADACVLALSWRQSCDTNLRDWLLYFAMIEIAHLVLLHRRAAAHRADTLRNRRVAAVESALRICRFLLLVWFVAGNYLLYISDTCLTIVPLLYCYVLAIIVTYYVIILLYAFVTTMFCFAPESTPVLRGTIEQPRGLTEEQLESLQPTVYNEESKDRIQDPNCVICLGDYTIGTNAVILNCRHHFHLSCLREWVRRSPTCPLCKQMVFYTASSQDHVSAV